MGEASGHTPASPFQPFHSLVLPFIACEPKREIKGIRAVRGTLEERSRREGEAGRVPASPTASFPFPGSAPAHGHLIAAAHEGSFGMREGDDGVLPLKGS